MLTNNRFIALSISLTVLIVFCTFILGLLVNPPMEDWTGGYPSFWIPIIGALISIIIVAGLTGFLRINQEVRKDASMATYLTAIGTNFVCGYLYYHVVQPPTLYYNTQYFLLFTIASIILYPFLVLILIMLNRMFIRIGMKLRQSLAT